MLERIREAVIAGNRAGGSPAKAPERGQVGYQGAGADPLARFCAELTAAGGQPHVVADGSAAVELILDLVRSRSIRRVLLGHGEVLDALPILEPLRASGVEVVDLSGGRKPPEPCDSQGANAPRSDAWFAAELGLSGVDYLIAETGSVVLASRPTEPRSVSLLPPIHIAVALRRQLLPDLFDLFTALGVRGEDLPSCLSIITGPSKTGDIELRLVTGVHGPGEIHVIVIHG
jgi:L-lactate dehydrogenase complex protein LldG